MENRFDPDKFYDHTIVDHNGATVGHVRVKPSSILWAPKGAKRWKGVTLAKFAHFMEEEGKSQKK